MKSLHYNVAIETLSVYIIRLYGTEKYTVQDTAAVAKHSLMLLIIKLKK